MGLSPLVGISGGAGLSPVVGVGGDGITRQPASPAYTGPLDLVPGAYCYSAKRALGSSMLGENGYTVQKLDGAGEPTQTFAYNAVTGEIDSAAITSFLDGEDGGITEAFDHGDSVDVLEVTQARNPKWTISSSIPRFTFTFADANILISANPAAFTGEFTFFAVLTTTEAEVENLQLFDVGNAINITVRGSLGGIVFGQIEGASFFAGGDWEPTTWTGLRLIEMVVAFENLSLKNNGADVTLTGDDSDGDPGNVSGVFEFGGGDGASSWSGDIVEMLVYPSLLTAPQRTAIRENIATYYGITLS